MRKRARAQGNLFLAAWLTVAGLGGRAAIAQEPASAEIEPAVPASAALDESASASLSLAEEEAAASSADISASGEASASGEKPKKDKPKKSARPQKSKPKPKPPTYDPREAYAEQRDFLLPINGMKFPVQAGSFARGRISWGGDGSWAVAYASEDPPASFTVRVDALPYEKPANINKAMRKEVADAKRYIAALDPNVQVLSEQERTIERHGEKVRGREVVFLFEQEFLGIKTAHQTTVMFFARQGFYYLYAISYPAPVKDRAEAAAAELFAELEWPEQSR